MSLRRCLPLLALIVAFTFSLPAVSAPESAPLPAAQTSAPSSCPAPEPTDIEWLAVPPPIDFLLCSCRNCAAHPYEDCSISPDGYSIACRDYLRINCDK